MVRVPYLNESYNACLRDAILRDVILRHVCWRCFSWFIRLNYALHAKYSSLHKTIPLFFSRHKLRSEPH